jgi:four helix bundle protein
MSFNFENLNVYKQSVEWVSFADLLIEKIKSKISHTVIDQFLRASLSIPLNIAEGSGRWHKADKKNFLFIARGSVYESIAILQIIKRKSIISENEYTSAYKQLESISKMLNSLIKSIDTSLRK